MSKVFQGFGEEYIRNHSHRRFGKWWQIPIHLVEVAFPDKFYNINGLHLSLGEPVYPVTRRYLTFSWEPPSKSDFPNLIKEFDQGNLDQLLGFEAMLTAFACGQYSLAYPQDSQEDMVRLFRHFTPSSEMYPFNKFFYYYYHRYNGLAICNPDSDWDLSIFDACLLVLLLSTSPRYSDNRDRQIQQELISLTNICRLKTSHWLNNPPQRTDSAHP